MQNDQITHLRQLAREARAYQRGRGWSDTQVCREIADLGSTKTFKRILDEEDDLSELNVPRQLKNYEAALEVIAARKSKDKLAEPIYDEFTNITESMAAVCRAMDAEGIDRFVCIEGESATGKDAVIEALVQRWPKTTVAIEANTFWEFSNNVPTRDIYNALDIRRRQEGGGAEPMPRNPDARGDVILEELNKAKRILMINEGHHCGPRTIDFLKLVLNKTPTVVVLLCIPALLRKLEFKAYDTAHQLFANRLCQRLQLPTPPSGEIAAMMRERGVKWCDAATGNAAATNLAAEAPGLGNWRFVVNVVRELALASRKGPLDTARFNAGRDVVKNRRVMKQQVGRAA